MTWPRVPYHAAEGQSATTAWSSPTLPHSRHPRSEPPPLIEHSSSSSARGPAPDAPAVRTPLERLASRVETIRALKRTRSDAWRQMAEELRQIKLEGDWQEAGDGSFDRWAWRVLRLNTRTVSSLLGLVTEPIGGAGRPKPGRPPRAGARTPARGQVAEVEVLPQTGSTSTSPSSPVDVSPGAAATARGALGWAARELGQIERYGTARWRAGLTDAARTAAAREFAGLSDLFACCARAASGPDCPDAGPGDD